MSSLGPNYAGNAENDSSFGLIAWTNPENAEAGNPLVSALCLVDKSFSYILKFSNFGFLIPDSAEINGIEVVLNRGHTEATASTVKAQMYKANVLAGTEKTSSTFTSTTLGTPTDLWGTTWTPAEINATDFGFGLCGGGASFETNLYVFECGIIVHYTLEGGPSGEGSASSKVMFHPF
jgi:hypothetical protein